MFPTKENELVVLHKIFYSGCHSTTPQTNMSVNQTGRTHIFSQIITMEKIIFPCPKNYRKRL